jgi:hypothetical protein
MMPDNALIGSIANRVMDFALGESIELSRYRQNSAYSATKKKYLEQTWLAAATV